MVFSGKISVHLSDSSLKPPQFLEFRSFPYWEFYIFLIFMILYSYRSQDSNWEMISKNWCNTPKRNEKLTHYFLNILQFGYFIRQDNCILCSNSKIFKFLNRWISRPNLDMDISENLLSILVNFNHFVNLIGLLLCSLLQRPRTKWKDKIDQFLLRPFHQI